jgi:dimethylamine/trimethylamine dehydrogenase
MARDSRYDILFEPVQIGPVTAPNRFYQVPHCNGMGYRDPSGMVEMRRIKAEGGWGVVCTEQAEIHHTSEITPFIEIRLWDDRDLPPLVAMCEAVHQEGALAGIELAYNGMNGPNFYTREIPMGPSHLPIITFTNDPVQARAMDREDIANLRRWHRNAALRAKQAGFDIVYVYAAHGFGAPQHFLSRRYNQRSDEYGGSLENRARLLRELVSDARDAVGDRCGVAVRISMDEMLGEAGLNREEVEDVIALMAELPDLWDLTLSGWDNDSRTSRFAEEGAQQPFVMNVKSITSKPVVGVGRFTSPDAMAAMVRKGVLDLIGAARPSIADPFLPRKIDEGRTDEIRECIGCNICVTGDMTMSPIRCTQNPTMGEEWRRGWHPERIPGKGSDCRVLVIGAGAAGLEAARALGRRGYAVTLAEAGQEPGGRVTRESRLPGLAAWARVRDHRLQQLNDLPNVEVFYDSALTADQVLEFGFEHVAVATGAHWRRDGIARFHQAAIPIEDGPAAVLTPDDLMDGARPTGPVVLFDDDHYYMGSVLAELLVDIGCAVTLVTPAAEAANWTQNTLEQAAIQTRLLERGVRIVPHRAVSRILQEGVETSCVFTGRTGELACNAVVLVTARLPDETLCLDLKARRGDWPAAGIRSITAIGDAFAPGLIAAAVYAGHRYARELDAEIPLDEPPFGREIAEMLPG